MRTLAIIIALASLAACSATTSTAHDGTPAAGTAGAAPPSLSAPLALTAGGPASGDIQCTIAGGRDSGRPLLLPITQPLLTLHRERDATRATLDAVVLPLGDLDISACALPPAGLRLRNLQLRLPAGALADVVSAGDDALVLHATSPLWLDWSLLLADGSTQPPGSVATEPLALDLTVTRAADVATLQLHASCAGSCWAVPGIVELSDGRVELTASAAMTAAD